MKIYYSPGGEFAGSITPRRFEVPLGERRLAAAAMRAAEKAAGQRIEQRSKEYAQPFMAAGYYADLQERIQRDTSTATALTIVAAELEGPPLDSLPEVYEEGESINLRYVYRGMLEGFCLLAEGAADRDATLDVMCNTVQYEAVPASQPLNYL